MGNANILVYIFDRCMSKLTARHWNAWTGQLCGVTKGVDEKIDEGVLQCFGHVERIKNDRTAKRVYVGESAGSRSVVRPRKKGIDPRKSA